MPIETKVYSSAGNYSFDPSRLLAHDLDTISRSTNKRGEIDPTVLIEIRSKYGPDVFTPIDARGDKIPPDHGPYEKLNRNRMADDLAGMLLMTRRDTVGSLSETRSVMADTGIIQAQVSMSKVKMEEEFAVKGALAKATGDTNRAFTAIGANFATAVGGARGAHKSGKAAAQTFEMSSAGNRIKTLENARTRANVELGLMRSERDAMPAGSLQRVHKQNEIIGKKADIENMDADIRHENRRANEAEQKARQLNDGARNFSMMVQAVSTPINSGGEIGAASANVQSTRDSEKGKVYGAEGRVAESLKEAASGAVGHLQKLIDDLLSGNVEQSGIEASRTIGRNI